jgi:hypothetical protein
LVRSLHGKHAKRGVFIANVVLQVGFALFTPRLDRVHIRELKNDDAVGWLAAREAHRLVVAAGQVLAAMIGNGLLRGLQEIVIVASFVLDGDLRAGSLA